MNENLTVVKEALKNIPEWSSDNVNIIRQVGDGPSNHSWLVEYTDKQYILRIDKAFANQHLLDRKQEARTQEVCSNNGLSPQLIFSNPDLGLFLSEFIVGRTWTEADLQSKEQLSILAKHLRKLHSQELSNVDGIGSYNLSAWVDQYAKELAQERSDRWAAEIHTLLAQISIRPPVLCHNDLLPQNIIEINSEGEIQLSFIDLEYSGLGNPLFDITTVINHNRLNDELSEYFLKEYFLAEYCGAIDKVTRSDLSLFAQINNRLLALWYSVLLLNEPADAKSLKHLSKLMLRI